MNSLAKRIILTLLTAFFGVISTKVAPDYIYTCPGLKSDCLKDNIQKTIPHFVKGIPSLGLNSTDPLQIHHITFDIPGGLKMEIIDGTLTGLRKCVVDSVKFDNQVAELKEHCDITIKGKYKAKGKILLFTLDGDGDTKIRAKNVILETKIIFEDKVRNGVEYREVKNIKTVHRFGDRVSFAFTNLFKSSPELSQTILAFLNENWQQVVEEFGKPIIEPLLELSFNEVRKFFKIVPKSELIV